MWLTDDRFQTFGNPSGDSSEFHFNQTELFSTLTLYGNCRGTHLGYIEFYTNKHRKFAYGMTDDLCTPFPVDVGSGILIGAETYGLEKGDLLSVAFLFMKSVDHAVFKDVEYPNLDSYGSGAPEEMQRWIVSADREGEWQATYETEVTMTSEWSNTDEAFYGLQVDVAVSAGIPMLTVEGGVSIKFELTESSTHSTSESHTAVMGINYSGTALPNEQVTVAAIIQKGEISIDYRGKVLVTFSDKTTSQEPVSGVYDGVSYTDLRLVVITDK